MRRTSRPLRTSITWIGFSNVDYAVIGARLGAYQAGVYQALHEGGIEPDWIVGTSIGAINGALIAGNRQPHRVERLRAFWAEVRAAAREGETFPK